MSDGNTGQLVARDTRRSVQAATITGGETALYPNAEPGGAGFLGLLARLRRRAGLVAGLFAFVAVTGITLSLMQTPKYTATALLVINPTPDQIVPEKQLSSSRVDSAAVDSEIEALKAPALAARLAAELNLDADPEWNKDFDTATATAPLPGIGRPTRFPASAEGKRADGDVLPDDQFTETHAPTLEATPSPSVRAVPDEVVDSVVGALDVRRRGLSNVVEVSGESASPDRAAEMANGLSNIYLKSLSEARYDSSERANVWLKDRLDELRREVQQKRAAAQASRVQSNLMTAQGVSLVEHQVAQIQSSLLNTRAEFSQKQAEHSQLSSLSRAGRGVGSLSANDDAMRDLRGKQAEVAQRIANLEQRYGPAYPALAQAVDEKAALDKQVAAETERSTAKARVEMDSIGARVRTQEAALAGLRSELARGNFNQVRLDALETDAQAAQSVYENFLQRYHEIARQGASTGVGARLLSAARTPVEPTSPHLLLNAAIVLTIATVIAILAGLLAEQFRGTIETSEEVEQRTGVRALVAVPGLRERDLRHMPSGNRSPTAYLLTKRLSQFAEAFRVLQAAILLAGDQKAKIVAITSAVPAEGKTTLSVGLARIAAMGGQSVIVIDCDIRMRSINTVLGIAPTEGLQQVLSGENGWREVVGVDQASGAHVLPASKLTSKDIFNSGAMRDLLDDLSLHYDLVILDCAPVFAVAETRVIASLADAVVVAARAGKTPARVLSAAIDQLELGGANVLGVALNRVDMRSARRSFYDGLYYSKAFRGYYAHDS